MGRSIIFSSWSSWLCVTVASKFKSATGLSFTSCQFCKPGWFSWNEILIVSVPCHDGKRDRTDWWCISINHTGRCRLGITGKSHAGVSARIKFSVILFRRIISPTRARVQTTQERGGIQFWCNDVEDKMPRNYKYIYISLLRLVSVFFFERHTCRRSVMESRRHLKWDWHKIKI